MLRLPCTCLRTTVRSGVRSIHAPASIDPASRIPKPRTPFDTPEAILTAAQRDLAPAYADKFESFAHLFSRTSTQLRDEVGMTIKQSRYLLRVLEKYRQGFNPDQVAVPLKPTKTIRGWGPKVQNGVRVR
ncbi:uncharacterized protein JCM15063_004785 [Sporobolomyces koalae]|uniref:uncharacterized protein n=1 Tax=Sporobolomyces koalae TaxID=500713 RepID=UPI003176FD63